MSINRDSDRYRLVRYDIERRQVVEDVYINEKYDVGGPDADRASLLFLESERKLIGVLLAEDKLKTVWFDDRFQSYQDMLDKLRPDTVNQILGWSRDGKVLLVSSYSDVDRGRYSIFRPELKRIITFADVNDDLRSAKLSRTKVIHFAARDGYELEGYLNLPVDHSDEPGKLVVLPHGGPWARDHWRFDPWVQFFATRGYAVLRVNFRGSTGYGREHLLAGLKKIDSVMIDDIADGVNWSTKNGHARPDGVYIFGHSYGGYAALMSTVRHPDLYAAAVAWSAPLDLMEQIKAYKETEDYFSYEFWKTAVGDPKREKDILKRISPINNADKMSVPILVFHGETDGIISSKQAQEFEKALRRANNDAEVLIVKDEGHTFSSNSNISYVLERTLRFFDQNQPH
jgi:dipeptidyl aminopeptidase/acylaminoacyl peptidase